MTALQNSIILDEEYEYEVSVLDLWKYLEKKIHTLLYI